MHSFKSFLSEASLSKTDIGKRNNLQFFADLIWDGIYGDDIHNRELRRKGYKGFTDNFQGVKVPRSRGGNFL